MNVIKIIGIVAILASSMSVSAYSPESRTYTPPASYGQVWVVLTPHWDGRSYATFDVSWGSYKKSFSLAKDSQYQYVIQFQHNDTNRHPMTVTTKNWSFFNKSSAARIDFIQQTTDPTASYPFATVLICGYNLKC